MELDQRFWEVDFIRGLAIVLAVFYNYLFALRYFGLFNLFPNSQRLKFAFWWLFPRSIASVFIFLVGVSLFLSYTRVKKLKNNESQSRGSVSFYKYFKRGLFIFSLGLVITLVTFLFTGQYFVLFGILHLIGASLIFGYFFLRYDFYSRSSLFLGSLFILTGILLRRLNFGSLALVWLGLVPSGYSTLDFFPIFPWFGFVLLGLYTGDRLYSDYSRNFKFPDFSENKLVEFVSYLGRNTLKIYLIHIPLLVIFLLFLKFLNFI